MPLAHLYIVHHISQLAYTRLVGSGPLLFVHMATSTTRKLVETLLGGVVLVMYVHLLGIMVL